MPPTVPKISHEPAPLVRREPKTRAVIYGDPGVGKTSLALTWPRIVALDFDGGLEGDAVVGIENVTEWAPEGWQDLNALYFWLKERADSFDTILIDSLDTMANFLLAEATGEETKNRKQDGWQESIHLTIHEQRDYLAVAKAIDRFLTLLRKLGKHIVLTSAVRLPNPEQGTTKRTPDVSPSVQSVVMQWANLVGELEIVRRKDKPDARLLHTQPASPTRVAKSRWSALVPGVANPSFSAIVAKINPNSQEESK